MDYRWQWKLPLQPIIAFSSCSQWLVFLSFYLSTCTEFVKTYFPKTSVRRCATIEANASRTILRARFFVSNEIITVSQCLSYFCDPTTSTMVTHRTNRGKVVKFPRVAPLSRVQVAHPYSIVHLCALYHCTYHYLSVLSSLDHQFPIYKTN